MMRVPGSTVSNPAEGYERFMVPPLFQPWARRLVDAASPRAGERILDLACGTGVVAREIVRRLGASATITAVDLNPAMLDVARAAAAAEGATIEWREARAEALPFPDFSFDLVLCQFAMMFFADRRAAAAEMRRVLADAGGALASVWQLRSAPWTSN
jgi:ubiquinone/menaquinone biosynthesis C-methylase UbiE